MKHNKWILCVAVVAYALLCYRTIRYSGSVMEPQVGEPYMMKQSALWRHIFHKWKESSIFSKKKIKTTDELLRLWKRLETADSDSRKISSADEIVTVVYEYFLAIKRFVPDIIYDATKEYLKTHDNMPKIKKRGPQEVALKLDQLKNPLETGYFNDSYKSKSHRWNYNVAKLNNVSQILTQTLLLQYFRIQKRIFQKPALQMMIIFNDDPQKYPVVLDIIQTLCTTDDELLYELRRTVTRRGMKQLLRHMYGMQDWVNVKEKEMLEKFRNETYTFHVVFFFPRGKKKVKFCKQAVRVYVNDTHVYNAAHFPDDPDQSLILAQVLLNENSMQYLNHGDGCYAVAKELGRRDKRPMITTYPIVHTAYKNQTEKVTDTSFPHIYFAREDVMLGPETRAGFFSTQNKNQGVVDLIFLDDIHKDLIGDLGNISTTIAQTNESTLVDYFFDLRCYGYCYGIKFLASETISMKNLTDGEKGGASGGRKPGQS